MESLEYWFELLSALAQSLAALGVAWHILAPCLRGAPYNTAPLLTGELGVRRKSNRQELSVTPSAYTANLQCAPVTIRATCQDFCSNVAPKLETPPRLSMVIVHDRFSRISGFIRAVTT